MNKIDSFIIKSAITKLNKTELNSLDKYMLKIADRRMDRYKAGSPSGGLMQSFMQDMIPYSIGDSARSYIRDGYTKNVIVYSVINLITTAASKANFKLFDISNAKEPVQVDSHPFLTLLDNPGPMLSRRGLIEEILGFKLLAGECFIYKNRNTIGNNKGLAGQLILLAPQFMKVEQDSDTGLPSSYVYWDGKTRAKIAPEDIIFIRCWNPDGGLRGLSPLKAAREVMAHSNDGYHANRKLLINGGAAGLLTLDDGTNIDFDDAQIDALQEKFRERYAGPVNYGTPIISNGKWSWTQIGLKGEDMQIVEGQRMSMRDICNAYGVSSQLLNDPDNKTYNNMQEARRALITNCVLPELHLLVDTLTKSLLNEYEKKDGKKYKLEVDHQVFEEIRDDEAAKVAYLAQAWWMSINEKRKAMGLPTLDISSGDDMYVPINFLPISILNDTDAQLRNMHAAATQGIADKPNEESADKK